MPIDISRLLNDNPELADRVLDAGSDAVTLVSERFDNASRTLRHHPGLLIVGGVVIGMAAAGVYLGARHWRARELERLRAEQRALELQLVREEQLLAIEDDFPIVDEPMTADGRSPEELEAAMRFPEAVDEINAADPDNPLSGGPMSQDGSVLEGEFADRNSPLDDGVVVDSAEDLVDRLSTRSGSH